MVLGRHPVDHLILLFLPLYLFAWSHLLAKISSTLLVDTLRGHNSAKKTFSASPNPRSTTVKFPMHSSIWIGLKGKSEVILGNFLTFILNAFS